MDALLGHYLTPTILLFDTPEQARTVEGLVRESVDRGALKSLVARVVSSDEVLPPDQDAKLEDCAASGACSLLGFERSFPREARDARRGSLRRHGAGSHPRDGSTAALTTGLREIDGTMAAPCSSIPSHPMRCGS